MNLFIEVVLPIVSIFLIGYVLQKWRSLDVVSASTLTIYVFIPFLVFDSFYQQEFSRDFTVIIVFSVLLLFLIIFINKWLARILKWDRGHESGMILSTAFMNSGNYGAPVILFAFGQEAFTYAVIFMSIQSMIMNIFGVYYASRGGYDLRYALIAVFKMPTTYAMVLALLFNGLNIELNSRLLELVDFMAAVGLPLMMVVLGMQLANITFTEFQAGKVALGTFLKLIVMPLIAWGLVLLLPASPLLEKVLIVQAAMPAAATTTMFALEFNSKPDLVSSVTLVTTLLSILTISILLVILV